MPMKHVHEYSQSEQRFEAEPQGVCQALSARWIVSRALWDPRRDGRWEQGRWMGSHKDMEPHVWRIYRATRAARAAVAQEERELMERATAKFNRERDALVAKHKRTARTHAQLAEPGMAGQYTPPGYAQADLDRIHDGVYIPTLPRMLEALMRDIAEHGGLDGTLHTQRQVDAQRAGSFVCSLGNGYKLINFRDASLASEGGAHAIAAEIRDTETRLFDPNYGEWVSEPPDNPSSSVTVLLFFLLSRMYELASVDYLSVIHFRLKAGQR